MNPIQLPSTVPSFYSNTSAEDIDAADALLALSKSSINGNSPALSNQTTSKKRTLERCEIQPQKKAPPERMPSTASTDSEVINKTQHNGSFIYTGTLPEVMFDSPASATSNSSSIEVSLDSEMSFVPTLLNVGYNVGYGTIQDDNGNPVPMVLKPSTLKRKKQSLAIYINTIEFINSYGQFNKNPSCDEFERCLQKLGTPKNSQQKNMIRAKGKTLLKLLKGVFQKEKKENRKLIENECTDFYQEKELAVPCTENDPSPGNLRTVSKADFPDFVKAARRHKRAFLNLRIPDFASSQRHKGLKK